MTQRRKFTLLFFAIFLAALGLFATRAKAATYNPLLDKTIVRKPIAGGKHWTYFPANYSHKVHQMSNFTPYLTVTTETSSQQNCAWGVETTYKWAVPSETQTNNMAALPKVLAQYNISDGKTPMVGAILIIPAHTTYYAATSSTGSWTWYFDKNCITSGHTAIVTAVKAGRVQIKEMNMLNGLGKWDTMWVQQVPTFTYIYASNK